MMSVEKEIEYQTGYTNVSPLGKTYEVLIPKDVDMDRIQSLYGAISPDGEFVILGEYVNRYNAWSLYHDIRELVVYVYDKTGYRQDYYYGSDKDEYTIEYVWQTILTLSSD